MEYNPALDGLRALAVLIVVAFHCGVPGASGGFFGVDLFFVLSGFLITTLLISEIDRTGGINLKRFYVRRLLRLGPPLVAMLVAYLAAAPVIWSEWPLSVHWRNAVLVAGYLTDYAVAIWHVPILLSHTWSLSIEEHFYLVWPVVIAWLMARRKLSVLMFGYAVSALWRITSMFIWPGWLVTYYRFDTHMSGLLLGSSLSLIMSRGAAKPRAAVADAVAGLSGGIFAAAVALMQWKTIDPLLWGITVVEVASAGLIIAACNRQTWTFRLLSKPPLVGIGMISYAVYLWHYPIARALRTEMSWQTTSLIVVAGSLVLAWFSWAFIERPIRERRRSVLPLVPPLAQAAAQDDRQTTK